MASLDSAERPARSAVSESLTVEDVGGLLVFGFGRLQRVQRFGAAGGDGGGGGFQGGLFVLGIGQAGGEVGDSFGGVAGAFGPAGPFGGDDLQAVGAGIVFPDQGFLRRAGAGIPSAGGRKGRARRFYRLP